VLQPRCCSGFVCTASPLTQLTDGCCLWLLAFTAWVVRCAGNRVTCRDWFQLTLKEGLTVFRDQGFSADMNSAPVKRIEVRLLSPMRVSWACFLLDWCACCKCMPLDCMAAVLHGCQ
jgi:hypothetical protein